jgi:hypothetical protein
MSWKVIVGPDALAQTPCVQSLELTSEIGSAENSAAKADAMELGVEYGPYDTFSEMEPTDKVSVPTAAPDSCPDWIVTVAVGYWHQETELPSATASNIQRILLAHSRNIKSPYRACRS